MAKAELPDSEPLAAPEHHLVVIYPFAEYKRGDSITDPAEIAFIKNGENHHHCRKVFPK